MKSKRVLSALLALALIFGLVAGCLAVSAAEETSFSDISGHWAEETLNRAVENGLLQGTNDGLLRPNDKLSRAQLAAIVVRAFAAKEEADLSAFADVDENAWYYEELSKAVAMGVLQGDGTGMRPNDNITRQEAFTVVARLLLLKEGNAESLKSFDDNAQVAMWAEGFVSALVENELVQGNGNKLSPTAEITRAEFATIFDRAINGYVRGGVAGPTEAKNLAVTGVATLKGVKITGDLYIGDGVGTDEIVLDGVTVEGRLVIRGGAKVILRNGATIKGEVVRKDGLTTPVVTEGTGSTGGSGGSGSGGDSNSQMNWKQALKSKTVPEEVKQYIRFAYLDEYQGVNFKVVPNVIPVGDGFNTSIFDSERNIWIGTDTGILIISADGQKTKIISDDAKILPYDKVNMLFSDGSTGAWVICGDTTTDDNVVCHIRTGI